MKFFSGFCFQNEVELFKEYLNDSDFCVAGFSKGAQEAFEFCFTCKQRIDKLQLFSPAFFQDKDERFKKLQLVSFRKNRKNYIKNFIINALYPSSKDIFAYYKEGSYEELKTLLEYNWEQNRIEELLDKGVEIEVFVAEKDKIITSHSVVEFFTPFADVYFIKGVGHTL